MDLPLASGTRIATGKLRGARGEGVAPALRGIETSSVLKVIWDDTWGKRSTKLAPGDKLQLELVEWTREELLAGHRLSPDFAAKFARLNRPIS